MNKMYTSIRPSQFMSDNPTKDELLFMYEWLYNSSRRKGDIERCKELAEKYNKIAGAKSVRVYTIEDGIPLLAGAVAGMVPNINYKMVNGKKIPIQGKECLTIEELKEIKQRVGGRE